VIEVLFTNGNYSLRSGGLLRNAHTVLMASGRTGALRHSDDQWVEFACLPSALDDPVLVSLPDSRDLSAAMNAATPFVEEGEPLAGRWLK
jgi:hypothetical protein